MLGIFKFLLFIECVLFNSFVNEDFLELKSWENKTVLYLRREVKNKLAKIWVKNTWKLYFASIFLNFAEQMKINKIKKYFILLI